MVPEQQKQGHLLQQRQVQVQMHHEQHLHVQQMPIQQQQQQHGIAATPSVIRAQSLMQPQPGHSGAGNMQMPLQQTPFGVNQQTHGMMAQQHKNLSMQQQQQSQHLQLPAGMNQAMGKMVETNVSAMPVPGQSKGCFVIVDVTSVRCKQSWELQQQSSAAQTFYCLHVFLQKLVSCYPIRSF